jgi:carbonic anhydrase
MIRRRALLALALAPLACPAAEWTSVSDTGFARIELDGSRLVREGEVVRAWDRTTYAVDQTTGSADVAYRSVETLTRYDCARRTALPEARVFHAADGRELMRLNLEGVELPQPVAPNSPRDRVLERACRAVVAAPQTPAALGSPAVAPEQAVAAAPEPREPKSPSPAPTKRKRKPRPAVAAAGGPDAPAAGEQASQANAGDAPKARWTYTGKATGPDRWHSLSPEYAQCAAGKRQSPIDIVDPVRLQIEPLRFAYKRSPLRVVNDGYTVRVPFTPGSTVRVGVTSYELQELHFHKPAEERVAGRRFDMSAHLVHRSEDGRILVVAVLLMAGDENAFIRTLWNHLPLDEGRTEENPDVKVDPTELLPKAQGFYTYMGSLHTPPCTEGVQWVVMKTPVMLSRTQIGVFGRLYETNARPIQPTHRRLVKESAGG